jgi:uncharacterized RDD family membrane protein YckC
VTTVAVAVPDAGVVSRGVAFAVDATVATVVSTLGLLLTRAVFAALGADVLDARGGSIAFLAAVPVVFAVYCAGFWALVDRTPGMMLLGLRVVAADGRSPGVRRSVVRALGYWVSAILLIGFAWIAVDSRHQGFHDKLAGTFVVYDWGAG